MELVFEDSIRDCFQNVFERVKKLVLGSRLGLKKAIAFKPSTPKERAALEYIMTYLLRLEAMSPGGIELFFQPLSQEKARPRALSRDSLESLLLTYAEASVVNLVIDALDLAGLDGKIILEKEGSDNDVVELTEGCFFPEVVTPLSLINTAFVDVRVVPIDGYLESVHEINRILEEAASNKDVVLLLVRGASDEVLHTLKVNYDRKTLTVIPAIIKYDLDGVNLLNDVATASCSDVVSALKGQLISSVNLCEFPRVERIDITSTGLLIENSKASKMIDSHISFLQCKLLASENETAKQVLEKRIKNLGSKRVTIKLRRSKDWTDRSFMIDRCLRAVKTSTSHGVIEIDDKLYPLASLHAARSYRSNFEKQLEDIACLLID